MSELIDKVAKDRYLRGNEKSMDDVYMRVADAVANNIDKEIYPIGEHAGSMSNTERIIAFRKRFYELMSESIFLPNTPTLSNAGTDCQMMSACFVLPVNDSFEGKGGIDDGEIIGRKIYRYGGGVGYNFSQLRPNGSPVKSTDGVASGPVSFMRIYDASCGGTMQGGRRRGASIGILNVDHPDIHEFITCKKKEGDIKNFNISVMVTDKFMVDIQAVDDTDYGFDVCKRVKHNKEIFDMIVDGIWNNGEPGLLFYDTINRDNPNKHLYNIDTVNPCGEEPLGVDPITGGGESCTLGSINVSKFYRQGGDNIDWDALRNAVSDAVVFLDTIITMNDYPTKEIGDMTKSTRKIGLGFMGLHDLFIKMGFPYGSEQSFNVAERLMQFIQTTAFTESQNLAYLIGTYPKWTNSEWGKKEQPIRNSTVTCVAPTGTISILAECSSGIEPHYNWVYERTNTVGSTFMMCSKLFEDAMIDTVSYIDNEHVKKILLDRYGVIVFDLTQDDTEWLIQDDDVEYVGDMREKLVDCIKQECFAKGSIQQIDFIPQTVRTLFKNALDISWDKHIFMQSVVQKWCDNSISKTVNLHSTATKDDVREAIIYAWRNGCKGFTMYRESSRNDVVLKLKDAEPEKKQHVYVLPPEFCESMHKVMQEPMIRERVMADDYVEPVEETVINEPVGNTFKRVLPASRFRVTSGCGDLYIHVAEEDGRVREVFVNCGGSGGCAANNNAIGRLISLALKNKVPIRDIIRQLKKVKCDACLKNGSRAEGKSCADVIGRVLEECIPEDEDKTVTTVLPQPEPDQTITTVVTDDRVTIKGLFCPECGNEVITEGRCYTCHNCGYSKCG